MEATIELIAKCLNCKEEQISNIMPMKAGMTNNSYLFDYANKQFILRLPGAGSSEMINRHQEYAAYQTIKHLNISDNVIYYDEASGIKISEYVKDAKTLNAYDMNDVKDALLFAKYKLHDADETSSFKINIIEMIEKYEQLMGKSKYQDYHELKAKIISKINEYSKLVHQYCMCHFDLNPDNFLRKKDGSLILLDWEYAGMNDPTFDLAGWIVYNKYTDAQVDEIIDIYYEHNVNDFIRKKVYAYIAAMGLLWSNWCEYKRKCGVEFGDYAEMQYHYASTFIKKS